MTFRSSSADGNESSSALPLQPYTATSIALHWLTAAAMAAILALAWTMTSLGEGAPNRLTLFRLHKSLGLTVLLFVAVRIWLRQRRRSGSITGEPRLARWTASATHVLLYVLLLVMPVSGYVMSSAAGHPVALWGLRLPSLPVDHALADGAKLVHLVSQWVLYGLIAIHVAGVVWHVWFRRDALLDRMLPPQQRPELAHADGDRSPVGDDPEVSNTSGHP